MNTSTLPQPREVKRPVFGVCNHFIGILGVAWLLEPLLGDFGGYWERIFVASIAAPLGFYLTGRWSRKS